MNENDIKNSSKKQISELGRDEVFSRPLSEVRAFEFNETVARVFQDMISRSVPGYDLLLHDWTVCQHFFAAE